MSKSWRYFKELCDLIANRPISKPEKGSQSVNVVAN